MKTILVTPLAVLLFILPNFSWAQFISVTGYVNDGENGKALENVSVFEANSGIGTISNQKGFYKLILEKGSVHLDITNDGFQSFSQKLDLISDTTLIVKLQPNLSGKTKQKKSDELHAGVKSDKKSHSNRWFERN